MKVVVQHPITHHYLTLEKEWEPRIQDARLFDSASEAVTYCFKNIKPPYNVVLKFEDPQYDFTLLTSENLPPPRIFPSLKPLAENFANETRLPDAHHEATQRRND
jgi:hypothetical protein